MDIASACTCNLNSIHSECEELDVELHETQKNIVGIKCKPNTNDECKWTISNFSHVVKDIFTDVKSCKELGDFSQACEMATELVRSCER